MSIPKHTSRPDIGLRQVHGSFVLWVNKRTVCTAFVLAEGRETVAVFSRPRSRVATADAKDRFLVACMTAASL